MCLLRNKDIPRATVASQSHDIPALSNTGPSTLNSSQTPVSKQLLEKAALLHGSSFLLSLQTTLHLTHHRNDKQ